MSNRRALIPVADLRRWAKVSREESVAIRGIISPDGTVAVTVLPDTAPAANENSFDAIQGSK
jgi:hypothetical protein